MSISDLRLHYNVHKATNETTRVSNLLSAAARHAEPTQSALVKEATTIFNNSIEHLHTLPGGDTVVIGMERLSRVGDDTVSRIERSAAIAAESGYSRLATMLHTTANDGARLSMLAPIRSNIATAQIAVSHLEAAEQISRQIARPTMFAVGAGAIAIAGATALGIHALSAD